MGKDDQLAYAYSILDRAVSLHKPKYAVAFFSGGYDSLVTTHLTMSYMERYYPKLPRFVAHINTGIGIEETRTFVRETCARYGWTLKEYTTAYNYDDLAMEYGFPGPALHGVMYSKSKGRLVVQMTREHQKKKFDRLAQNVGRVCQEPAAHRDGGRALSHVNTERKKEEARGRNPRGDSMTTIDRDIRWAPAQIAIPPTLTPGEQTPAVMTPQQRYRQAIEGIWQKVDQLPNGTRTPLVAPGKESN